MPQTERTSRSRWTSIALVAAFVILIAFGIQQSAADVRPFEQVANLFNRPGQQFYNGQAQIDGPIQLTAQLSPPAAQVGDLLTLSLELRNQNSELASPTVEVVLPPNVVPSLQRLPTGVSVNVSEGKLSWQPVLVTQDSTAVTNISLRVEAVDPDQPDLALTLFLRTAVGQQQTTLPFWAGLPPSGQARVNPGRAAVGQPIQFSSDTEGSGPFTQLWFTGDGRIISAQDPVVVYPLVGIYDVDLHLANPLDVHESQSQIVIVPDPVAFFNVSDTTPSVGQPIQFNSQGGGQPPLTYIWDFGDGSLATAPNPTHRYNAPGSYNVRLVVRNAYGEAQNNLTIHVGHPPIADMEARPQLERGAGVQGQAFTDDNTQKVSWEMGDGTIYEGDVVTHRYRQSGTYMITMRASNQFGETVISRLINVEADAYYIYLPAIMSDGGSQLALSEELFTNGQLIPQNNPSVALSPSTIDFIEVTAEIVLGENTAVDSLTPAEQLIWYINDARRQAGLNEVALTNLLSRAAKQHTDDMANNAFTGHTGSDGSPPYERLARVGYREGGYAGETTAWGFRTGREAVEFWLESPPHRAILLNPLATHVGVAQTTNYNAPSVWYWTAEFASSYGSIVAQMREAGVRQIQPAASSLYSFGETIPFSWSWPLPLEGDQRFILYIRPELEEGEGTPRRIGTITDPADIPSLVGRPQEGTLFAEQALVNDIFSRAGEYGWYVQLEDSNGELLTASKVRALVITGTLPTATPPPILLPTLQPTIAPTSTPTPSPTPPLKATQPWPTDTPVPTLPAISGPTATPESIVPLPTSTLTGTVEALPTMTLTPTPVMTSTPPPPQNTAVPTVTPTSTPLNTITP